MTYTKATARRRAATVAGTLLTWTMIIPGAVGPGAVWADPPAHAPAHGYRAKEARKAERNRVKSERKEDKRDSKRDREQARIDARRGDLDRDGIPDYRDRDRDGDGVSNGNDRHPQDPRRR